MPEPATEKLKPIGDVLKGRSIEDFKGFATPNTTATPDEIFDRFLTELTHAELKVILYIVRRTFGFKKAKDKISLKQISQGIITKEGKELDYGAGITKRGAIKAVQGLEKKGLIEVHRVKTKDGYNEVNTYSLRFREK